ncbi:MAG: nuclear transport factor 2 family protein [Euryarchaeota archaeon]|nr:nuclear transport factor 2 family protein [Euryarchaeota archaeon]
MPLPAEDRLAILELCARYNRTVDSRDTEGWLSTWTDDGVFETTFGTFQGRKAMEGFLRVFYATMQGKRHWSGNHIIEGDGDTATLTCDLMLLQTGKSPGVYATGTYTDALRRVAGAWRFSRRKLALDSAASPKAGGTG